MRMAIFRYESTDEHGDGVHGYLTATDQREVEQRLSTLTGSAPHRVFEVSEHPPAQLPLSLPNAGPRPETTPRPLNRGDNLRAYVTRNFNAVFGGVFLVFPALLLIPILASGAVFPIIFLIPFGAVGWWIARKGIVEAQEDIWLVQHGATTMGTVTKVGYGNSSKNGQKSFVVHYEYEAEHATFEGSVETFNRQITRLDVGSQTWVLFHPDQPGMSMIWPAIWRLDHKK